MRTHESTPWHEANQRYLLASLGPIREALEHRHTRAKGTSGDASWKVSEEALAAIHDAARAMPAPPAIDRLSVALGLTAFERDVVLLAAGVELDASLAERCARLAGDPRQKRPTWSLALAALPDAHWSALSPAAPLRYFRVIE